MSQPILTASEAGVRYPGAATPALENATMDVHAGTSVGIVGESGSGKTTFGRVLVGLLHPSSGSVLVDGRAWKDVRRTDAQRRNVQMIFQDPYGSLNGGMSGLDAVAEVLEHWEGLGRREARDRAGELLTQVGLPKDAMRRRPRELSGGQCQRVGIARALACSPSVLIADEPTSSLDVSVQAQILNLLLELRRQRELALVLISHDLAVIRYMTEEALVMKEGQVVERGSTYQLLEAPGHPYTQSLVESIPGWAGRTRRDTPEREH